jgi:hypothetical protein
MLWDKARADLGAKSAARYPKVSKTMTFSNPASPDMCSTAPIPVVPARNGRTTPLRRTSCTSYSTGSALPPPLTIYPAGFCERGIQAKMNEALFLGLTDPKPLT